MSELLTNPPQDWIKLAGFRSPGLCEIVGARMELEYLVKQPPGATGTRMLYKRRKPSEFEVKIRCYTAEDLAGFEAWRASVLVQPDKRSVVKLAAVNITDAAGTRTAQAMDIHHPILADLGINAVVVLSVSQLERVHDSGVWQCTIKFLQFIGLPEITQAEMDGSQADPVPESDADKEIKALSGQVQALAPRAGL